MGIFSTYTLEWDGDIMDHEIEEWIDALPEKPMNHNGLPTGHCKWYSCGDDLMDLSLKHPDTKFVLWQEREQDDGASWMFRAKAGVVDFVEWRRTYDSKAWRPYERIYSGAKEEVEPFGFEID
jgi:hypothetical protein